MLKSPAEFGRLVFPYYLARKICPHLIFKKAELTLLYSNNGANWYFDLLYNLLSC